VDGNLSNLSMMFLDHASSSEHCHWNDQQLRFELIPHRRIEGHCMNSTYQWLRVFISRGSPSIDYICSMDEKNSWIVRNVWQGKVQYYGTECCHFLPFHSLSFCAPIKNEVIYYTLWLYTPISNLYNVKREGVSVCSSTG